MTDKKTVGERLVAGLTRFAEDLKSDKNSIRHKYTCHRVKLHLQPTVYSPETVKQTRDMLDVSQAIFAEFLGVSVKTVQAWEQGINQPLSAICRFMDEIRHNPEYWQERIVDLMMETA